MKKDKVILILFSLSFILIAASVVLILTGLSGLEGSIVIHFNTEGEADFINGIGVVWNIVWIAAFMSLINLILSFVLYNRQRILSYILTSGTLLLSILTLITISTIVSVN